MWEAVQKVDTLRYVTRGVLGFRLLDPIPARLSPGDVVRMRLLFLHFVPAWKHEIRIVHVDERERRIETAERGGAIRTWNHVITVEPAPAGTRYTDALEIDAGNMTPLVEGYAKVFYRYRQRRWRRLAKSLT